MDDQPKFNTGQFVIKTQGARFGGCIVGSPYRTEVGNTGEKWHYNVVAVHPLYEGTVHILIESQMREMTTNEQFLYNPMRYESFGTER